MYDSKTDWQMRVNGLQGTKDYLVIAWQSVHWRRALKGACHCLIKASMHCHELHLGNRQYKRWWTNEHLVHEMISSFMESQLRQCYHNASLWKSMPIESQVSLKIMDRIRIHRKGKRSPLMCLISLWKTFSVRSNSIHWIRTQVTKRQRTGRWDIKVILVKVQF